MFFLFKSEHIYTCNYLVFNNELCFFLTYTIFKYTLYTKDIFMDISTKDENDSIVFLLAKANQKAQNELKKSLKPYGITTVQGLLLGLISIEEGITASEIGKKLVLDNATVSGVLERLASSNWIIRKPDKKDKRVSRIHLLHTPEKDKIMPLLKDSFKSVQEELLQNYTLEERILLKRFLRDFI
jgi:DNA-binding MarR family transcriptional regulator